MKFLSDHQKEFKLRKVIPVPVSGAFHTNLMLPAADTFSKVLDTIEMFEPTISSFSNVEGRRYKNLKHMKKKLPLQICRPVLWEQILSSIYNRPAGQEFPSTFICGPKANSLRTILKEINAQAAKQCLAVES